MLELIGQTEALTKAANDVLAAQDMLTMWKAIAVLGWLAAGACYYRLESFRAADVMRLQKLVDTYQAGKGDTRG